MDPVICTPLPVTSIAAQLAAVLRYVQQQQQTVGQHGSAVAAAVAAAGDSA